jgi:hypothetical protein
MSDIVFRRIRGRVVPIKKKKDLESDPVKGSFKAAGGASIAIGGSLSATKSLEKSFKAFRKSSQFRGASKITTAGTGLHSKLIRLAAKSKLSGVRHRNVAKGKFGIALAASSFLISSGVSDFFKKDSDIRDEVSGAVGTAASAAAVSLTARKFGIRAKTVNDLFLGFARKGKKLSTKKIKDIASTKFDPSRKRKGTQLKFDF